MSDRRPASTRTVSRRALGAGAAGLAAVLAAAPFAHAAPAPTPSDTATSAPAAPGSATASGSASSSPSAPVHVQSHTGAQVKAAPQVVTTTTSSAPTPQYGFQKYRIGVQQKDGSYWPPGVTSANAKLHVVETGPSAPIDGTFDCYTQASTATAGSTATYCTVGNTFTTAQTARLKQRFTARYGKAAVRKAMPLLTTRPGDANSDTQNQNFIAGPGDTVTVTQETVGDANLQTDDATATLEPCVADLELGAPLCDTGSGESGFSPLITDEVFDDAGPLPVAVDDSRSTDQGKSVDVVVTANDETKGTKITGLAVGDDPKHGTATVLAGGSDPVGPTSSPSPIAPTTSAAPLLRPARAARLRAAAAPTVGTTIRYTPKAGFSGTDTFTYQLSTVNGSAPATVTIHVAAAPSSPASSTSSSAGTLPSASSNAMNSDLASTGSDTQALGEIALGLIVAGGVAAAAGRRRLAGRSGRNH